MSKETLGKLALIQGAVDGRYTVNELSKKLKLSKRRIKQLKKAYRENGENAVIHGNTGRHPGNYTEEKLREKITALKKSDNYKETNFTHFQELLLERENIKISYTTLCSILKKAGIVSKKKHRTEGRKFKSRKRRGRFGEMLQADGSTFDWFGTGRRCALHGFIDDATGRIVGLYFCLNECLMGYLEVLRQTLNKYGIPLEIYADKAGIFTVNNKNEANWTIEEQLAGAALNKTQFGKIVENHFRIGIISAHTPQAKGRIERLWGTLQDRLPIWLRLQGITNMEQANLQIKKFITEYNNKFAVKPDLEESSFEPLNESFDLDKLLAVCYERTTDNCGCFSFNNITFQIDTKIPIVKKKIKFLFSEKIGFQAFYDKVYYPVSFFGMSNKCKIGRIPDVLKVLIEKYYFSDGRNMAA